MPVTDGPQVLEMLMSDEETKGIPVIFLTGKDDKESVMSVLALKPEGYVLKTSGKNEIVKTKLTNKERFLFFIIASILSFLLGLILIHFGDTKPFIDSVTTIFSILGMYLTVRRTIDQWIVWMLVNGLSLIMWLSIAMSGVKVYSTIIMWGVYFILAFYFYYRWKKEVK